MEVVGAERKQVVALVASLRKKCNRFFLKLLREGGFGCKEFGVRGKREKRDLSFRSAHGFEGGIYGIRANQ